ncbi:hypothetical protein F5050DRAFT_1715542 [Lentinula boryana]|uniref:Uncharacterized protein n=1 Tax=Lentinula boryana TaxID=40481 RepID=A0ABQ8Q164_9AGAR|nr:hypothetical protein F5050DRAFT_1715542 [Lentinula boryana]
MSSVFENTEAIAAHPAPALYVPVHKRTTSRGGASGRFTTPTSEHESSIESSLLPIYSIQDLLMLSESPVSHSSPEQRDYLKDVAPEILLGHRQRKALEHQRHVKIHVPVAREVHQKENTPFKSGERSVQRRSVRQGRLPERRRHAKNTIDELSWRAPRMRTISAAGSPLLLVPTATA